MIHLDRGLLFTACGPGNALESGFERLYRQNNVCSFQVTRCPARTNEFVVIPQPGSCFFDFSATFGTMDWQNIIVENP